MRTVTPTPPKPRPVDNLPDLASAYLLRRQLRRRLLTLSYHAFAQCLCLLLTQLGYQDVQVAGRKDWKGRNREGGYDIQAALPAGLGQRRVIIQAKQLRRCPSSSAWSMNCAALACAPGPLRPF